MERHGEVGKECEAINLEIVGKADGRDDGARSEIDQCACCNATVLQIEVHVCLALRDDAKAMVVDDKWRCLLHDEMKHTWVTMHHAELAVEMDVLAYLSEVAGKDISHLRESHQSGLLVHDVV